MVPKVPKLVETFIWELAEEASRLMGIKNQALEPLKLI